MKANFIVLGILFFLFYLPSGAQAQDTMYYQYPRLRVASLQECDYYSLITTDPTSNNSLEIQYNQQGNKIEEQHYYISGREKVKFGIWKTWFPDGNIESEIQYANNRMNGYLKTFWPDGVIRRVDTFLNDSCIAGVCYDKKGLQIKHFDYHVPPQFPGGVEEMFKFLKRKIYFPQTYDPAEGKVIVRFLVQKDGQISDIELMNSTGKHKYMENQVLHAIKIMPDWIPGKTDGVPDAEFVLLPVTFTQI